MAADRSHHVSRRPPTVPPREDFSDQSAEIDAFTKSIPGGKGLPMWAKVLGVATLGVPVAAVIALGLVGVVAACWKGITFLIGWAF